MPYRPVPCHAIRTCVKVCMAAPNRASLQSNATSAAALRRASASAPAEGRLRLRVPPPPPPGLLAPRESAPPAAAFMAANRPELALEASSSGPASGGPCAECTSSSSVRLWAPMVASFSVSPPKSELAGRPPLVVVTERAYGSGNLSCLEQCAQAALSLVETTKCEVH